MPPKPPRRRPLGPGPTPPPPPGPAAPAPAAPEPGVREPGPAAPGAGAALGPEADGLEGEAPDPDVPQGEAPDLDVPQGEAPDLDVPQGEAPDLDVPQGEAPDPDVPQAGGASERGVGALAGPVPAGPGAGAGRDDAPDAGGEAASGRFTVRLANFEGPFDLLLQLIAKHRLDVTEVALSRVTDEFMAYIRAMGPDWDLDQTTEFLVVAATLLDLKTARLLPAAEVEDEADLALLEARDVLFARLLQYRAYKQVAAVFSDRLDDEGRRYPRTVGLEPHHAELLPDVVLGIGPEGFARLAVRAMRPKPEPRVYVDHIHAPLVSVREQADVVVALLRERGEARFSELARDAPDTLTVVARFLALLELYRDRAVALDQDDPLGELTVRWTGGDADARVTDEFDRAAEDGGGDGTDAGAGKMSGSGRRKEGEQG
ncbi:segregation and condensation protein A [Streptomyces thermolilacinus]|uniref:segregation and condensation protein A n=1 Tax=Streptomyces thermolilacinus TaxID=285540 RepID=UPI0033D4EE33